MSEGRSGGFNQDTCLKGIVKVHLIRDNYSRPNVKINDIRRGPHLRHWKEPIIEGIVVEQQRVIEKEKAWQKEENTRKKPNRRCNEGRFVNYRDVKRKQKSAEIKRKEEEKKRDFKQKSNWKNAKSGLRAKGDKGKENANYAEW
jgi:hypothetical protein